MRPLTQGILRTVSLGMLHFRLSHFYVEFLSPESSHVPNTKSLTSRPKAVSLDMFIGSEILQQVNKGRKSYPWLSVVVAQL